MLSRTSLQQVVDRLRTAARTQVMGCQLRDDIRALCDHVFSTAPRYFVQAGEVSRYDFVSDVVDRYTGRTVASFTGDSSAQRRRAQTLADLLNKDDK